MEPVVRLEGGLREASRGVEVTRWAGVVTLRNNCNNSSSNRSNSSNSCNSSYSNSNSNSSIKSSSNSWLFGKMDKLLVLACKLQGRNSCKCFRNSSNSWWCRKVGRR